MTKDERIKELESAAMQLFDMVHESENIQNKIKANDLYDTIIGQSLPIDSVSQRSELLIDYMKWFDDNRDMYYMVSNKGMINKYIKSINCG